MTINGSIKILSLGRYPAPSLSKSGYADPQRDTHHFDLGSRQKHQRQYRQLRSRTSTTRTALKPSAESFPRRMVTPITPSAVFSKTIAAANPSVRSANFVRNNPGTLNGKHPQLLDRLALEFQIVDHACRDDDRKEIDHHNDAVQLRQQDVHRRQRQAQQPHCGGSENSPARTPRLKFPLKAAPPERRCAFPLISSANVFIALPACVVSRYPVRSSLKTSLQIIAVKTMLASVAAQRIQTSLEQRPAMIQYADVIGNQFDLTPACATISIPCSHKAVEAIESADGSHGYLPDPIRWSAHPGSKSAVFPTALPPDPNVASCLTNTYEPADL